MEGRASGWKEVFRAWSRGTFDNIHVKGIDNSIPLDEVKSFFNKLDIKRPELLFPDRGLTPWLFPELDYEKLSETALKWAKKYPFIERIRLYKNPDQAGNDGRYLLIFETFDPTEYTGTFEDYDFREHFLEGPLTGSDFEEDLKTVFREGYTPPLILSEHWRPLVVQPGESAFDQEAPPPFNTESGINEQSTHWVLFDAKNVDVKTSDVTQIIKDAHREGFIYIDDLVVVHARETGFTEKHLPVLWEKFDLKKKGDDFGPLSDSGWRFNRWMRLFYRIAFGISIDKSRVDVLSASRFKKLVPKHKHDNGEYLPADLSHFKQGGHNYGECFIKIEDLRDYLVNYAGIPAEDLPGSLFPPVVISEESTGQRPGATEIKKSPDQQPETPKEKTQWETMADWIKTNHPDEWGLFADKCLDPDKPETGARPHYWNREKWCRIISLQKRLANPEHFKKPKDVYNHMLTDKKLRPHLLKTDRLRQKIKIENTEAGAYDLKQFKKWTRDVWPDELFKKGREKTK